MEIFQVFVRGNAIGGWRGKFYSKKCFPTREAAEAYIPEFHKVVLDPKQMDALSEIDETHIVPLELVE
jgi:hypothetical protein